MLDKPQAANLAALEAGSNLPAEKQLYVNGFAVGMTAADITVVLQNHGQAVGTVVMTHSVAKALSEALDALLKTYQQKTRLKVVNVNKIAEMLTAEGDNNDKGDTNQD